MEKKTGKKRLTMCDWCVLVAVISLFASLAHPTISQAVDERKLVDMVDRLQRVRAHIQLYKAEHDGLWPGQQYPDDDVTADEFAAAMTEQRRDAESSYLQQIPDNPYRTEPGSNGSITCVHDPDAKPAGNEGTAWWFNSATGEFYACDSQYHANY